MDSSPCEAFGVKLDIFCKMMLQLGEDVSMETIEAAKL